MLVKIKKLFLRFHKYFFLFLIAALLSNLFFGYKKKIVSSSWPLPINGQTRLSCSAIQTASIFADDKSPSFKIEGVVEKGVDADSIALEISESSVKFLTSTSVRAGMMDPLEMPIVKETEQNITAMAVEFPPLGDAVTNSLLLNKETGLAIWVKAVSGRLSSKAPYSLMFYYQCS